MRFSRFVDSVFSFQDGFLFHFHPFHPARFIRFKHFNVKKSVFLSRVSLHREGRWFNSLLMYSQRMILISASGFGHFRTHMRSCPIVCIGSVVAKVRFHMALRSLNVHRFLTVQLFLDSFVRGFLFDSRCRFFLQRFRSIHRSTSRSVRLVLSGQVITFSMTVSTRVHRCPLRLFDTFREQSRSGGHRVLLGPAFRFRLSLQRLARRIIRHSMLREVSSIRTRVSRTPVRRYMVSTVLFKFFSRLTSVHTRVL